MRLKKFDNYDKTLLLILALFLFLSLILATQVETLAYQDSHWHVSLAKNLVGGKGYTLDGQFPHGKYPPGIAILLAPIYLLFGNWYPAGIGLMILISVLSIILVYKIGSFSSKRIGLIAAGFLAFQYMFVYNSVVIMTEIPFMFFSLASIFFFIRGFRKNKLFFWSLLFFAMASLIRYDGFLIFLVFIYYGFKKRKEVKNINLNGFILGSLIAGILIGIWLVRNWIVFGNPLHTDYMREITGFNFFDYLSFLKNIKDVGITIPILATIGILPLFRENNPRMKAFFYWLIIYVLLHMYWSTRASRFYIEVMGILVILATYGLIEIYKWFNLNQRKRRIFTGVVFAIFIVSQAYLFFSPVPSVGTTMFNWYQPIKDISVWANKNLEDDAFYAVPDVAVYSLYLNKPNIVYSGQGINLMAKGEKVYILTDSLHIWMTKPFLAGKNGTINLNVGTVDEQRILTIKTKTLVESRAKRIDREAYLFEITDFKIT